MMELTELAGVGIALNLSLKPCQTTSPPLRVRLRADEEVQFLPFVLRPSREQEDLEDLFRKRRCLPPAATML